MSTPHRKKRRPNALLRLVFRLPLWIYRLRLGWLLGRRFLMITHQGRRTGVIRRTVVEAVRYNRGTDEFVVVAGYGKTSDWYRNIQARPALQIDVGGRRFTPTQRFLNPEEMYEEFKDYERRHPRLARTLARMIGLEYQGTEAQRRALATELPMIALSPK